MVLLPGCKCCETCGWPGGRSAPDSVEVVLEDVAPRTFSVNGINFATPTSVYVPSLNGTFSLSPFTPGDYNWFGAYYIYKGTSNGCEFQVGLTWNVGQPNYASVFDNSLGIGCYLMQTNRYASSPPTTFLGGGPSGVAFGRRCTRTSGETFNFTHADGGSAFPQLYFPAMNRDVSYESGSGCYLPANAAVDVLFRTDLYSGGANPFYSPTSHDFPISRTVADPDTGTNFTTIGFRFSVRVVSVSLIYGSTSVPFLDNLGQTTCPTL